MQKSAMTYEQLNLRNIFIDKLESQEWKIDENINAFFDKDYSVEPEAVAYYTRNSIFFLRLSLYFEKSYIYCELIGKSLPIVISLRCYYEGKCLKTILELFVSIQDSVSEHNYPDFVKDLILVGSLVLIETDEGLLKASF